MFAALSAAPSDQVGQDRGSSFKSLFDTLNHVYLAELVWLRRVQGDRDARIDQLKTPADLSELGQAWPEVHGSWIEWARPLSGDDLQQPLTLRNMKGAETQLPYWQLVMHLVNHGSYHRGQLATMLRQAGIKPPGTDLITYYRTR